MKRILFSMLFVSIGLTAFSQTDFNRTNAVGNSTANMATYNKQTVVDANLKARLTLFVPKGTTPTLNNAKDSVGAVFFSTTDSHFYVYRGSSTWDKYATYSDVSNVVRDSLVNYQKKTDALLIGGVITSIPTVGFDVGTNITTKQFITNAFYQSQAPTSGISGGSNYELHSAGTFASTLNWSAGRYVATQPLSSIVVAGVSQTFTQPSAGGSVSGTQGVTVTWNTNVTYSNTVTTVDSKSATSSTTYAFYPKLYYGSSASATPNNAIILASAGGGNYLTGGRTGTFVITASGSNYPFFSYPSNLGSLTSIKDVNNFEVLSSFNQTTVSVTNASGFVQPYLVYTLNASTASNYQITTQ